MRKTHDSEPLAATGTARPFIIGFLLVLCFTAGETWAAAVGDALTIFDSRTGKIAVVNGSPLQAISYEGESESGGLTFEAFFVGVPGTRYVVVTEAPNQNNEPPTTGNLSDVIRLDIEEVAGTAHRATFDFTYYSDPIPASVLAAVTALTRYPPSITEIALNSNPDITRLFFPNGAPANILVYFQSDLDGTPLIPRQTLPDTSGRFLNPLLALGGCVLFRRWR